MITINLFSSLTPLVQLVLVVGIFVIALLAACNRVAAANLVAFLHDLYAIHRLHRDSDLQCVQHLDPGSDIKKSEAIVGNVERLDPT